MGIAQEVILRINCSDAEEYVLYPRPMLWVRPLQNLDCEPIIAIEIQPNLGDGGGVILHDLLCDQGCVVIGPNVEAFRPFVERF